MLVIKVKSEFLFRKVNGESLQYAKKLTSEAN